MRLELLELAARDSHRSLWLAMAQAVELVGMEQAQPRPRQGLLVLAVVVVVESTRAT